MPITITRKDGLVEFACPMCLRPTVLPATEYDCKVQDGRLTISKTHSLENENPHRIDLRKNDGHTVNCDFTLVNAPIVIAEPPKAPAGNSSQDSQTDDQ